MLILILLIQKKGQLMIDMDLKKIGNLNIGRKGTTGKDIHNKTNFKIFLEHFLEVYLRKIAIGMVVFNSIKFYI
jgi:hypothetical protein